MAQYTNLAAAVSQADLIITGEGRLDGQTLYGKAIRGVTDLARQYGKPVIAFCGQLALTPEEVAQLGLRRAIAISPLHLPFDEARQQAPTLLANAVADAFRAYV